MLMYSKTQHLCPGLVSSAINDFTAFSIGTSTGGNSGWLGVLFKSTLVVVYERGHGVLYPCVHIFSIV